MSEQRPVPQPWPHEHGPSRERARHLLSHGTDENVYVLGIDQAQRSGWAVHDLRRFVLHGFTTNADEQQDAVKAVRKLPGFDISRLLVLFEDHSNIPASSGIPTKNILSLGDSRGGWRMLLEILKHPPSQRMLVEPSEWRRVMGVRINLPRAAWKKSALFWATVVAGQPVTDDNEAEAMAIAQWGAVDGLFRWAKKRELELGKRRSA
jgi:hypothetical protein